MDGLSFNGLGWVWAIHTLLNELKLAIEFLMTKPIYYPSKLIKTHPFDSPSHD